MSTVVIEAFAITSLVFIALTVFTIWSKIDFSFLGLILPVLLFTLIIWGFFGMFAFQSFAFPQVYALGGTVIHDPEHAEVGVREAHALDAISGDPLFGHLPASFPVLMGHHDRVVELPPGAHELVFSDTCRNQAFKMEGVPVYGTQFHSELTPERLIERLTQFRQYMPDADQFESMKSSMRPTPEAAMIMPRFLEHIAGN